jgi:hypothetical protein
MRTTLWIVAGAMLFVCMAATASATPPPAAPCVGGYNPNALSNVCFAETDPTNVPVGEVGTDGSLCIIGNVCVPFVTYDPFGGPSVPVPGHPIPSTIYIEVLGCGARVVDPNQDVGLLTCLAG